MNKSEILAKFDKLGRTASYHYADDSGKEWSLGSAAKTEAINLYVENPELRREMFELAKEFLWSLRDEISYPQYQELFAENEPEKYFIGNYGKMETPLMIEVANQLGYEAWVTEDMVPRGWRNYKSFYLKGTSDLSTFWRKYRAEERKKRDAEFEIEQKKREQEWNNR